MEELAQSLAEIEARRDVSVIVLSGDGKAFSAGVDVAAHTPDKVEEMLTKFHCRDPRAGGDEESHDRRGAWALSGRWRGTGDGVRHGLHHGIGAVGISGDQAGLLSAGGLHRTGCARGTEARGGTDSDRTHDRAAKRRRRSVWPIVLWPRVSLPAAVDECIGHLRKLSPAALGIGQEGVVRVGLDAFR